MEQFNPSLRNFIAMGKNYEKALAGVTYAAKGYFDALVKMGELASESQGSKELGDVLFQMAEVHRQIQNQLEEMLKSFHNELLTQLEQKVELDSRYLSGWPLKGRWYFRFLEGAASVLFLSPSRQCHRCCMLRKPGRSAHTLQAKLEDFQCGVAWWSRIGPKGEDGTGPGADEKKK
ncbi:PREDICTED: brain-specific angiogenesis inhibitor 1-associated protein 2-like [Mandrillus leucophaeus]|uniref:brain-specific angiogenesis inhibitor 1-associated protein 2-like n=1 Tax=Mandrillus leucophaeus TaxID=9568 RepID=UPI0005F552F1|nr:PREDICTED: brain-specific angiogenesis inhibitor 1-associated protein 2-like [Mandrillus leucophaeus]